MERADKPDELALALGESLSPMTEEPEWVYWDPSTADPHCLIAEVVP